ncbi:MAG: hypothetical protein HYR56_10635 [Acidobacteria bacterium]|nr:hypothetical protein [Acidobacteriota bacterium]MBI3424085.1 hypothetical protein [Acidobacteriota bacterium]
MKSTKEARITIRNTNARPEQRWHKALLPVLLLSSALLLCLTPTPAQTPTPARSLPHLPEVDLSQHLRLTGDAPELAAGPLLTDEEAQTLLIAMPEPHPQEPLVKVSGDLFSNFLNNQLNNPNTLAGRLNQRSALALLNSGNDPLAGFLSKSGGILGGGLQGFGGNIFARTYGSVYRDLGFSPSQLSLIGAQFDWVGSRLFDFANRTNFGLLGDNSLLVSRYFPDLAFLNYGGFGLLGFGAESAFARVEASDLETRYNALMQRLARYSQTDQTLAGLRKEYNQVVLRLTYGDPFLLYWNYALTLQTRTIYNQCPSYRAAASLSATVATWTAPPNNQTTLNERYRQRLQLANLQLKVQQKAIAYVAARPSLAQWFSDAATAVTARYQLLWEQQAVTNGLTAQAWQSRWQTALATSAEMASIRNGFEQLLNAYPMLREYTQVNEELNQMASALSNEADVKYAANLAATVAQDARVSNDINWYYNRYLTQVGALIGSTGYYAELERFSERLNGALKNDAGFGMLEASSVASRLENFQAQVYAAINRAYNAGNQSNPYFDRSVVALYDTNYAKLMSAAAVFCETVGQTQFNFYNGAAFASLTRDTAIRIQATVGPVRESLAAAQTECQRGINAIPQVAQLQQVLARVEQALRYRNQYLDYLLKRFNQLTGDLNQLTNRS